MPGFCFFVHHTKLKSMKLALIVCLSAFFFSTAATAQSNGSFDFEGLNRTYLYYVPEGHNPQNPAPLVLVLHGFTQNAQMIMQYSNFNHYAEENGFIVAYPNGVGNAWNIGPGGSSANDKGFLPALIDTLTVQYGVDQERIYACGFSNGGFMSYLLACEMNERFAAIGSVAGTMSNDMYDNCMPGRPFPVIHIHGTADFIVGYNGGFGNRSVDDVIDFWTANNLCPAEPEMIQLPDLVPGSTVEQYTYAPCDDSTEVVLLRVVNGGHTWPGAIGNSGIGVTNQDISASEEIWKFVSRFSRPTITGEQPAVVVESLKPYPNPAKNGMIRLQLPQADGAVQMALFSTDGRLMHSQTIENPGLSIQLSTEGLQPGMYFVRLYQKVHQYRAKFVVD